MRIALKVSGTEGSVCFLHHHIDNMKYAGKMCTSSYIFQHEWQIRKI